MGVGSGLLTSALLPILETPASPTLFFPRGVPHKMRSWAEARVWNVRINTILSLSRRCGHEWIINTPASPGLLLPRDSSFPEDPRACTSVVGFLTFLPVVRVARKVAICIAA